MPITELKTTGTDVNHKMSKADARLVQAEEKADSCLK